MNLKLIKNTENINKEKITLFCLPFAGGGASAYNQWAKKMQGKVTVCPVQLPGREEQIMEKPYIDMSVMLDDLEEAVRKVVYGPYALWGHSMGGRSLMSWKNGWRQRDILQNVCLFPAAGFLAFRSQIQSIIFRMKRLRGNWKIEGTPKRY